MNVPEKEGDELLKKRALGPGQGARVVIRFGDHVLDTERLELRRAPEPIALEHQVFDLLVYLLCGGPLTSN